MQQSLEIHTSLCDQKMGDKLLELIVYNNGIQACTTRKSIFYDSETTRVHHEPS